MTPSKNPPPTDAALEELEDRLCGLLAPLPCDDEPFVELLRAAAQLGRTAGRAEGIRDCIEHLQAEIDSYYEADTGPPPGMDVALAELEDLAERSLAARVKP